MPEAIIDIVGRRPETVTLLILLVLALCCLVFSMVKEGRARSALRELEYTRAMDEQRLHQLEAALENGKTEAEQASRDTEHWRQRAATLENRVAGLESESKARLDRIEQLETERKSQQQRADELSRELGDARVAQREQEVTLDKERRATTEKLELLERNRDALKQEFENLANRIFEQKSERFSQQTRTSIDTLLNPFRDQLQDFRKRVEDVYTTETRDRQALRLSLIHISEPTRPY